MPLLSCALLLATAQGQTPKVNAPKGNPKLELNLPAPKILVLPLFVQSSASAKAYKEFPEDISRGFADGIQNASKVQPVLKGECNFVQMKAAQTALDSTPGLNKGTKEKPTWAMAEVAKVAASLGADFIILPYLQQYQATMDSTNHTSVVKGVFTMWSAKTAKVIFGDAPFGGTFSRPKAQGMFNPYQLGYNLGDKELRYTFWDFWGKKNINNRP